MNLFNLKTMLFISLILAVVAFTIYYFFNKDTFDINVSEIDSIENGFNSVVSPQEILSTPYYKETLKSDVTSLDSSLATCAVALENISVDYSNGQYTWTIKAIKNNKLLSFNVTDELKNQCAQGSCSCINADTLSDDSVCYVSIEDLPVRVYVNPYYHNSSTSDCSFEKDTIPLTLQNSKGNSTSYVEIPGGSDASDDYTVTIPVNTNYFKTGCLRAGMDIIKVNNNLQQLCSVSGKDSFLITASSKKTNVNSNTKVNFYSIVVDETTEDTEYNFSCYLNKDSYSPTKNYSVEVYSNNELVETVGCTSTECLVEDIFEETTQKVLRKFMFTHKFEKEGEYLLKCVIK